MVTDDVLPPFVPAAPEIKSSNHSGAKKKFINRRSPQAPMKKSPHRLNSTGHATSTNNISPKSLGERHRHTTHHAHSYSPRQVEPFEIANDHQPLISGMAKGGTNKRSTSDDFIIIKDLSPSQNLKGMKDSSHNSLNIVAGMKDTSHSSQGSSSRRILPSTADNIAHSNHRDRGCRSSLAAEDIGGNERNDSSLSKPIKTSASRASLMKKLKAGEERKSNTLHDSVGDLQVPRPPGGIRRARSAGNQDDAILASFSFQSNSNRLSSGERLQPSSVTKEGMDEPVDSWYLTKTVSTPARLPLMAKLQADEKLSRPCPLPSIAGDSSSGGGGTTESKDASETSSQFPLLSKMMTGNLFDDNDDDNETEGQFFSLDQHPVFFQFDPSQTDHVNLMIADDDKGSIFPMKQIAKELLNHKKEDSCSSSKDDADNSNKEANTLADKSSEISQGSLPEDVQTDEINFLGGNWKGSIILSSDNACIQHDKHDQEKVSESRAEDDESSHLEYTEAPGSSEHSESSSDEDDRTADYPVAQCLLQLNLSNPDAVAVAACDADDTSIFRMEESITKSRTQTMEPNSATEGEQEPNKSNVNDKMDKSEKRGSLFSAKLLKATSFKKSKASSLLAEAMVKSKSFRRTKDSRNKHMILESNAFDLGEKYSSKEKKGAKNPDNGVANDKETATAATKGDSDSNTKETEVTVNDNERVANVPKKELSKIDDMDKSMQRRRRDTVKSRREATRDKTIGNKEQRNKKREAYRKATQSRNATSNSVTEATALTLKQRSTHIGQGRHRALASNEKRHAVPRVDMDRFENDRAKEETTGRASKAVVDNIRKRATIRKAQSVRDLGRSNTSTGITRSTSGFEDNTAAFRRTASTTIPPHRSASRKRRSERRQIGRSHEEGDNDLGKSSRGQESSHRDEMQASENRHAHRPRRVKSVDALACEMKDASRESNGDDKTKGKRRSRRRGHENGDIDMSGNSIGAAVNKSKRRPRRILSGDHVMNNSRESAHGGIREKTRRRKASGEDMDRSAESTENLDRSGESYTGERIRAGKKKPARRSRRNKDEEDNGADLDSNVNNIDEESSHDLDASHNNQGPMVDVSHGSRSRRKDLSRSNSSGKMRNPEQNKSGDRSKYLPLNRSSSLRVERTAFHESFPSMEDADLPIDRKLSETFHESGSIDAGDQSADQRTSFMKSLGAKIGANKRAGNVGKGGHRLISIGGLGGGRRTEKQHLLDVDDDSMSY